MSIEYWATRGGTYVCVHEAQGRVAKIPAEESPLASSPRSAGQRFRTSARQLSGMPAQRAHTLTIA